MTEDEKERSATSRIVHRRVVSKDGLLKIAVPMLTVTFVENTTKIVKKRTIDAFRSSVTLRVIRSCTRFVNAPVLQKVLKER